MKTTFQYGQFTFSLNQSVYFGRERGEKTLGKIIKLNTASAKIQTCESRGNGRASAPGRIWNVTYGLITPADVATEAEHGTTIPAPPALERADKSIPFNHRQILTYLVMREIVMIYRDFPEFGDHTEVAARLDSLTGAFNREVTREVAIKWDNERFEWENINGPVL
jgi:hypothetical protein